MEYIEILWFIAWAIWVSQNIPQIIKVYVTKEAKSLSLMTMFMMMTSASLWMTYWFFQSSMSLVITNALFVSLLIVLLTLKLRYDKLSWN